MANYNKSFNFRNGVQVDNDNFIVNANGLVGIGTSIPTEFLDVYGTAKITGLVTTTNLYVSGISTFYNDVKVGSAITLSPSTGAVSATIFYGSAVGLTSIYAIAVDGWYISSGVSTTSKVGIGTTNPEYSLQVGQNPSIGNGFSVDEGTGNVNTTGIATAYSFSGFGTDIQGINASNISNGTLNNSRLPQNISISGIATAYSFSGFGTDIQGINASNISNGTLNNSRLPQNISISGILTANSGIIASLRTTNINNTGIATLGIVTASQLHISGIATLGIVTASQLYISGIATLGIVTASQLYVSEISTLGIVTASQLYVSGVTTSFGGFVGNVTGNVTGTSSNLTGTPNIAVENVNSSNINNTGIITSVSIISGISSVSTRLYAESIGVGTNSPESDIHIGRTLTSRLQLTSSSAESIVILGRSTILTGSNGALRFGNSPAIQQYSTAKSLDIINYDTGNINSYLQLGSSGINTGSFHWFYGQTIPNVPLMSLTYGGKLGIGNTDPINTLHVVGTSTVTGDSYIGNDVHIGNNLNISGTLSVASLTGSLTGNVTGNLIGNVNAITGISTFNQTISSQSKIQYLGIVESAVIYPLEIGSGTDKVVMNGTAIGISTTIILPDIGLDASNVVAVAGAIGIGTTLPQSYADFSNAGAGSSDNPGFQFRFMIPPKVSSTDRVGLTTVEGGMIYNTTVRRLELYLGNGRGWVGIATVV